MSAARPAAIQPAALEFRHWRSSRAPDSIAPEHRGARRHRHKRRGGKPASKYLEAPVGGEVAGE